jgi:hypothetical protein
VIVVPADVARPVRAAARRLSPGRTAKPPPVEVVVGIDGLVLRVATADAAIEYRRPGPCEPGRLVLPADALAVGTGSGRSPLRLVESSGGVEVRWSDRGTEQQQSFPKPSDPKPFPDLNADKLADNPPTLISALADAAALTAKEPGRYATHRVQLRGRRGQVAATDTHHLLAQGGFEFPWDGDLLVPRAGAALAGTLGVAGPVRVGRTATHVVITSGKWRVGLTVDPAGRFPDTDRVVPRPGEARTRWVLDEGSARELEAALATLPGREGQGGPVTVDLAGPPVVRARGEHGPPAGVVLSGSRVEGHPVRFCTDRAYLRHALRLGLREFSVGEPGRPVLGRDGSRAYVWVPLDPSGVVGPEPTPRRRASVPTPTVERSGPRVPAVRRLAAQAGGLFSLVRSTWEQVVR